jgi:hypothetical protein
VAALDARARALTDREETAHREAALAAAAKDRAAGVEQEACDCASAAARDTATRVKDARTLLVGEWQKAARHVAAAEAVAADAAMCAAAAEEKAARMEAAAWEAARVDPPANLSHARGQLHQLADGVRALTRSFKEVGELTGLGEVEFVPLSDSPRTSSTSFQGWSS